MNEDKKIHREGKPANGQPKAGFAMPGMMAPGNGGHGAGQPGMMNRPMDIGKMTAQQFKPAAPKLKPGETVNAVRKTFPVMGMSCASCARGVENVLNLQDGVLNASVNFAASTVLVEYIPEKAGVDEMQKAVKGAGYELLVEEESQKSDVLEELHQQSYRKLRNNTLGASMLALPVFIIGMFFMNMPYANVIMWVLSTPVLFWFGRHFFVNAVKQARHRTANMDTLVAVSTGVAWLFSVFNTLNPEYWHARGLHSHVYFEAAAVIVAFILLGRLLEEKAKGNTSAAIKKLMGLQPREVTIVKEEGHYLQLPVDQVHEGDIIMVRPGQQIAVDGTVTDGNSFVDESMLSGEPVPVLKTAGDPVFAGTINQKGSFSFKATKVGSETRLSQIIRMVQEAQGSKAPVQKLVDRIAAVFVPVVMGIALLSFIAWVIFGGENGFTQGLLAAITVLVIACPCALGLATPTALMVGIGKGASQGILIRDAGSLELARKMDVIILDKTGTITEGKPEVTDVAWLNGDNSMERVLVSLEKKSEHPLAEAVTRYFKSEAVEVSDFKSITGKGASVVYDGKSYFAGNLRLLSEHGIQLHNGLLERSKQWEGESKSVIWFADEAQALAVIAIADRVKPSSAEAIGRIRQMGIEVIMLTGDNEATAAAIAGQVGIGQYHAGLLPDQKAGFIKSLQENGSVVAMAGDGINDSAAMAQADVSIAMGQGSDIAMDVAEMTLISSDLNKIPDAIRLSRHTVRTVRQNLFWAFIYNVIGIPVAAGVLYPFTGFLLNPMIAGAAMALSSVSVVTNSLRLKWKK